MFIVYYLYSGATTRTNWYMIKEHNTSLLRACGVLARERARFPPRGLARGAKQQLEQPAAAACTPCDFFPGRLAPPRAEIRTRTNIARRRPALWGPGKHLGCHEFRPSHVRCGVRAPAAAPPRSRHVPRAAGLALVVAKSTGRYRARGAGVRTARRLIPQPL